MSRLGFGYLKESITSYGITYNKGLRVDIIEKEPDKYCIRFEDGCISRVSFSYLEDVEFIEGFANMTQIYYDKRGSRWVETDRRETIISEKEYKNIVESRDFFVRLGGYERHIKSYTSYGYTVTTIYSLSPDRKSRIVREFKIF